MSLTVQELVDANRETLPLEWIAGRNGSQRKLAAGTVEPADLIGHLNLIHPARIHVLGHEEIAFFARLPDDRRQEIIQDMITGHPPALIIAEGLQPPAQLLQICQSDGALVVGAMDAVDGVAEIERAGTLRIVQAA